MKKKYVVVSLAIMIVLFIAGLCLIFSSTGIGDNAGYVAIQANGGMDAWKYNNVITSTTENFRTAGMVISLVGGLGVLLSGYGVYRELQ